MAGASDASMQLGVERVPEVQLCFARLTAGVSDASMQVDVQRVLQAQVLIARLTAGASDVSMQVGVERVPETQVRIALLTVAESDVSMQVGVERVPETQVRIALLTVAESDVSMQVAATSMLSGKGCVSSTEWRLECGISICGLGSGDKQNESLPCGNVRRFSRFASTSVCLARDSENTAGCNNIILTLTDTHSTQLPW
jgi:hypothetical protein